MTPNLAEIWKDNSAQIVLNEARPEQAIADALFSITGMSPWNMERIAEIETGAVNFIVYQIDVEPEGYLVDDTGRSFVQFVQLSWRIGETPPLLPDDFARAMSVALETPCLMDGSVGDDLGYADMFLFELDGSKRVTTTSGNWL